MNRNLIFLIGFILIVGIIAIIAAFNISKEPQKEADLGKSFNYEMKNLPKTAPDLIKYKEVNNFNTNFQEVHSIAVDSNDNIYVAGDREIKIFDKAGELLSKINLINLPLCLTVSEDGTIYVCTKEQIEIYDQNGALKMVWESLGKRAVLTSIEVYGENVFVADAGNRVVYRYDSSGNLINKIGEKDPDKNIPGFVVPSPYFDLAVAPDGLLRIINPGRHRIEAYTFDGYLELWWGKPSMNIEGFSGCCNPVNFAILDNGKFVTCEKGIPRAKIYSSDGSFECVVASKEFFRENRKYCSTDETSECQTGGLDVAVDSQERVLLLDLVENTVRIFKSKIED